jgi:hypothetical protein
MARNRRFGKPHNLIHREGEPFSQGDSSIQLVCDDGVYGAWIECVLDEPVFLHCEELLGLAHFIERRRTWLEEHAQANREWYDNEEASRTVLVSLLSLNDPDDLVVISFQTENRFAWYGRPVSAASPESGDRESEQDEVQEYLRSEWEEYGARRTLPLRFTQAEYLDENSL